MSDEPLPSHSTNGLTGHPAPPGPRDRSSLEPDAVPMLNPRLRRPRRPAPERTPWLSWAIFAVYLGFSLLIFVNPGRFVRAPDTYRYVLALVVLLFGLYRLTMGQARRRQSLLDDDQ